MKNPNTNVQGGAREPVKSIIHKRRSREKEVVSELLSSLLFYNANLGYLLAGTNHTVTTNNDESRKRKKKCFPQTFFSSSVYVLS